jgi:single-stranded DNA-specific DHH superfamily exonuclease
MHFFDILSNMNKIDLIDASIKYVPPIFSTEHLVLDALKDIKENNRKVYLYGDPDNDGAVCIETFRETFSYIGYTNYDVHRYSSRKHTIDVSAVNKCISGGYDYMIICDAGSQEPEVLSRLNSMGIKTILLDHHQSSYDYEDFQGTAMINTAFENRRLTEEIFLSAGALCFVVCDKFIKNLNMPELPTLAPLALASLYSDQIDMSGTLNRSIYYLATSSESRLPKFIQHFMTDRDSFTRRFVDFHLAPRINSLFRSESFDLLNRYLFWKPGAGSLSDILDNVNGVYFKYRESVNTGADIIETRVLDNFVLGNLSSITNMIDIPEKIITNYTGLVANKLADKYKRTAIVYGDSGVDIKCSLRDLYGRNYLEIFKQFSKANGHNAAFSISVGYLDFNNFISYIEMIDKQFYIKSLSNEPIIVPHNVQEPDARMVIGMALYNEFCGGNNPKAYLSKNWLDDRQRPYEGGYYMQYKWGSSYKIKTKNKLRVGSQLIIQPFRAKAINLVVTDVK